jgi:hypothetical protein
MTFYACTPLQTYTAEILTPFLDAPARKAPVRKARKSRSRPVNYKARNRPGTVQKQEAIARWLRAGDEGFTVSELAALLGISRQLCLYHVKKMAAQAQIVMILEPCDGNGGLQYKVWDKTQLVVNYVPAVAREAA